MLDSSGGDWPSLAQQFLTGYIFEDCNSYGDDNKRYYVHHKEGYNSATAFLMISLANPKDGCVHKSKSSCQFKHAGKPSAD